MASFCLILLGMVFAPFYYRTTYTRGPDGSLLVTADDSDDHPGLPGKATNSVGAGDSFTATFCMGLLNKKPLSEINLHALQVSTFVCMQDSATPVFSPELIAS